MAPSSGYSSSWLPNVSQSVITGVIVGGSLIGAAYYFYATSSSGRSHKRIRAGGTVPAMRNLGNTCYANSLLQGLASSPAFTKWISSIDVSSSAHQNAIKLIIALKQTILQLNDPSTELCSAAEVISALLDHRWSIPPNSEQDLYELFNVLVTTWDEEIALLKSERLFSLLKVVDIKPHVQYGESGMSDFSPLKSERVDSSSDVIAGHLTPHSALSFEHIKRAVAEDKRLRPSCFGLLATQLRCCQKGCGYKKFQQEKFVVLSLSIPKNFVTMPLTLESLLQKFFCAELIQGASCERCVKQRNVTCSGLIKKQGFCKLPMTLILRVERVGYLPSGAIFKHSDYFAFPETLDIRDFCFFKDTETDYGKSHGFLPEETSRVLGGAASTSGALFTATAAVNRPVAGVGLMENALIDGGSFIMERNRMVKYRYQLRAVAVHIGEPNSGHFITYRRGIGPNCQNSWYKTSDSQITRVGYSEVASCQAYMLFYDKIVPFRHICS